MDEDSEPTTTEALPRPPPATDDGGAPLPGFGRWPWPRTAGDRKVKGVAGGTAAAAGLDPTLVRLVFVLAALAGWGIVLYLVLALTLPDETETDPARPLEPKGRKRLRLGLSIGGVAAAGGLLGGWFLSAFSLVTYSGGLGFVGPEIGFPQLLIAAGAAVLWLRRDRAKPGADPAHESPKSSTVPGGATPSNWPTGPRTQTADIPRRPKFTGHDLLRLVVAFTAIGVFLTLLGGGFLVTVDAIPISLPFLPAAIGIVGLGGLALNVIRRGRPAGLLIPVACLLVAPVSALGLVQLSGGIGGRSAGFAGSGEGLLNRYEQVAGEFTLNLGDLELRPDARRPVKVRLGIGKLTVIVPPDVTTEVNAQVGTGQTNLFDEVQDGIAIETGGYHSGQPGAGVLVLDLHVGLGEILVLVRPEPTFDARCEVPAGARGDGTEAVTCPHPSGLARVAMACSVALINPGDGGPAGEAFCRRVGTTVPDIGTFAVPCTVPAENDVATCARFEPIQLRRLDEMRRRLAFQATAPITRPPTTEAPVSYLCTEDSSTGLLTCSPA